MPPLLNGVPGVSSVPPLLTLPDILPPLSPLPLSGISNEGGGAGGSPNQYAYNVIQYWTIPTLGNAVDFGDLTVSRGQSCGLSNSTRVAFAGGVTDNAGNTASSVIDYVQASSTGNAVDFGDTNADTKRSQGCCGDSHGGLGGG